MSPVLQTSSLCYGFEPIINKECKVLILGTMPSVQSLKDSFYYAHPRNAFWPIMQRFTQQPITDEQAKRALLLQAGIALWDVLKACQRQGSLDSAIQNPVANDFESLFNQYPHLSAILFNGKKAQQLFQRHVVGHQAIPETVKTVCMPSTSPANAMMNFEDKYLFWQEKLSELL